MNSTAGAAPHEATTAALASDESAAANLSAAAPNTTHPAWPQLSWGLPCDWFVWDICPLVLFVLGTIGNVLSVFIMRQRGMRSRSYSISLSVLALFNSLTLLALAVGAVDKQLSSRLGAASFESRIGTVGCMVYRMVQPVVRLMSHWVVVFITAERFVAICFPLAVSSVFSRPKFALFSLFVLVVVSQIWRPFFDYQKPAEFGNGTNGTKVLLREATCYAEDIMLYQNISLFFHELCLLSLLPAVLVFVMNSAVIAQIYKTNRAIRKSGGYHRGGVSTRRAPHKRDSADADGLVDEAPGLRGSAGPPDRPTSRNRKTTVLLLAVSCSFLLYLCPMMALMTYIRIVHLASGFMQAVHAFRRLCTPIKAAHMLTYMSYSDNFVVFLLAGERFRSECKLLIRRAAACCCPRLFPADWLEPTSTRNPSTRGPRNDRPRSQSSRLYLSVQRDSLTASKEASVGSAAEKRAVSLSAVPAEQIKELLGRSDAGDAQAGEAAVVNVPQR